MLADPASIVGNVTTKVWEQTQSHPPAAAFLLTVASWSTVGVHLLQIPLRNKQLLHFTNRSLMLLMSGQKSGRLLDHLELAPAEDSTMLD